MTNLDKYIERELGKDDIERIDYFDGDGISVDYLCCVDREDLDNLEAKLTKAIETLAEIKALPELPLYQRKIRDYSTIANTALKELKGDSQ